MGCVCDGLLGWLFWLWFGFVVCVLVGLVVVVFRV